jgi:hypothetical protein
MEIRVYDNENALPFGVWPILSSVFITNETVEKYDGVELQDFLKALLSVNLLLTAHVFIDRTSDFAASSKVSVTVTSLIGSSLEMFFVWDLGQIKPQHDGCYNGRLFLDVDLNSIIPEAQDKWSKRKKDLAGWKSFFHQTFEDIRKEKMLRIISDQKILNLLIPSGSDGRSTYTGSYAHFAEKIVLGNDPNTQGSFGD